MFDKAFALDVAWPAAVAAYQAMTLPLNEIGLPAGYEPLHYIMSNEGGGTVAVPDPYGVIGVGRAGLLVALRGTETLSEWMDDFEATLSPWPYGTGCVHTGFLEVYQHIRPSLVVGLGHPLVPKVAAVIVGHSLGGALALLLAKDLLPWARVYTFGSPRVGDKAFAGTFDSAVPDCERIVNEGDLVPQVPLPPLFSNVGLPQTVRGGFEVHDISFSHQLSQYRTGLLGLP